MPRLVQLLPGNQEFNKQMSALQKGGDGHRVHEEMYLNQQLRTGKSVS